MLKKYGTLACIGIVIAALGLLVIPAVTFAQSGTQSHGGHGEHIHTFYGDKAAYRLLINATATITAQSRAAVNAQLAAGKSIGQIADDRRDDVITRFNLAVAAFFKHQVATGQLPQSVADARQAWYQRDAQLMIDQPGLQPRFPGLHEVHVGVIAATIQVTGATRAEIKAALEGCSTISAIATGRGKTAADIVSFALSRVDERLRVAVEQNKLTTTQRDLWRAALADSINAMMTTPGLHFAGKECAP